MTRLRTRHTPHRVFGHTQIEEHGIRNFRCMDGLVAGSAATAWSQTLPPEAIVHPKPDSWPTFHGDYSGRHYSPLKEINAGNVHNLTLSWVNQISMTPGANIGGPARPEPSGRLRQHPVRAADGGWRPVYHGTQHGACHRRAHRPRDLEIHLERPARLRPRQSRRGHLRRLAVLRDLRQSSGLARHQRRARNAGTRNSPM